MKDLFENMTDKDPEVRFNIEGVKNHEWYNGKVFSE